MFIAGFLFVVTLSNLDLSAAQPDAEELPSLCCITGDRRNYRINTTFITADCKSKCVCTQDAYLACIPLCPKAILKCPVGFKQQSVNETVTQTCNCPKYECVRIPGEATSSPNLCRYGGKRYKPGDEFTRNCQERCRCQNSGQVKCVSLCPNNKACMVDHTEKNVLVPTPDNKCQCLVKACKPLPYTDKCDVNGQTYWSGDSFVPSDCSNRCTCTPGGKIFCMPLCLPQGNHCELGEQAVTVQETVLGTNCTCPSYKCAKSDNHNSVVGQVINPSAQVPTHIFPKHQCTTSSGMTYPIGSVFADKNCTSQCFCQNGGVISCHALCAPVVPDSSCTNPKIVQIPTAIHDAQGKSCYCPHETCA
ncbi:zonadhesin-like [Dendronephthya gigantea]|uniref:zonadhesin-like n=1 Tax=Dendronephthya gigantea TaxID=151771 RepID=UPI001069EE6F|nr:zonadhesin-like [Dendronephthya gigantea]XP_028404114.1 zonadhesin-like [Dendronephthya gigantea]